MKNPKGGFSYIALLIAVVIVAWLTAKLMKPASHTTEMISDTLKANGIEPLKDQPLTPANTEKAVETAVKELQRRGEERTKNELDAIKE